MQQTLQGLVVVDLTQVVSGAIASMLMAEAGADVIKVEPPAGEAYRRSGHPIETANGSTNLNIMRFSRRKRSVSIDLKSQGGQEVLARLLADADILIENFRPGVLSRLGFPPERLEALNPALIYTTVSGFGHDDIVPSAMKDMPTYAIVAEAMAGLMHLAGDGEGAPVWMGFAMADIFAGVLAFSGTLMALLERERSEHPSRRVDVAMYDGAVLMNDLAMTANSVLGEVMGGGRYSLQAPWGPYRAEDGYVVIAVLSEKQWDALCKVIERVDLANDERLSNGRGRSKHLKEIKPAVEAWTSERAQGVVVDTLADAGVPCAPVRTSEEVRLSPQTRMREMIVEVIDPVVGPVELVGNPIKLDQQLDASVARIPSLGEHTREVLREHGYSEAELQELLAEGSVIDGDRG